MDDNTRRVEFTETPKKPWPDFDPVKGQVYDLPPDQAARAVGRGVARYVDGKDIVFPVPDGEAKKSVSEADAAKQAAKAEAEAKRQTVIAEQTKQAKAEADAQAAAERQAAADDAKAEESAAKKPAYVAAKPAVKK